MNVYNEEKVQNVLRLTENLPNWVTDWLNGKNIFLDISLCSKFIKPLIVNAIFQLVRTVAKDSEIYTLIVVLTIFLQVSGNLNRWIKATAVPEGVGTIKLFLRRNCQYKIIRTKNTTATALSLKRGRFFLSLKDYLIFQLRGNNPLSIIGWGFFVSVWYCFLNSFLNEVNDLMAR